MRTPKAVRFEPNIASGYDELPGGGRHEALAEAAMLRKPYDREQMDALLNAAMAVRVSTGFAAATVTGRSGSSSPFDKAEGAL